MNKLQVQLTKFDKQIKQEIKRKHPSSDRSTISINDYGVGLQTTIHVWEKDIITHSYYTYTTSVKKVREHIRHTDGV